MIKKEIRNSAVSEILGSIIILSITVAIFASIYVTVLSEKPEVETPIVTIRGTLNEDSILLTHYGGEPLSLDTKIQINIANSSENITVKDYLEDSYKIDREWNIGEPISYQISNYTGKKVEVIVIDINSKDIIFKGIFKAELDEVDIYCSSELLEKTIEQYKGLKDVLLQTGSEIGEGEYNDVIDQYLEPALTRFAGNCNHLYIENGTEVFDYLKQAISKINGFFGKKINGKLISGIPEISNNLTIIQQNLVKVGKNIADILLSEIGEKSLTPSQQSEYQLGINYFNNAKSEADMINQVDYYKKAWEQGVKVLDLAGITTGIADGTRLP